MVGRDCTPPLPPWYTTCCTTVESSLSLSEAQKTMGYDHVAPCAGRCAGSRRPDHAFSKTIFVRSRRHAHVHQRRAIRLSAGAMCGSHRMSLTPNVPITRTPHPPLARISRVMRAGGMLAILAIDATAVVSPADAASTTWHDPREGKPLGAQLHRHAGVNCSTAPLPSTLLPYVCSVKSFLLRTRAGHSG
jgi:hypothetical protein